jgi:hypothetical protein
MQSQVPGPVSLIIFLVSDVSHASSSDEDDENELYDAPEEHTNQDTDLGHRRNSI